jgi:hypothetical protein
LGTAPEERPGDGAPNKQDFENQTEKSEGSPEGKLLVNLSKGKKRFLKNGAE